LNVGNFSIKKSLLCFASAIFVSFLPATVSGGGTTGLEFEGPFFQRLMRTSPILRDRFIETHLNRLVSARGKVISVDKAELYNGKARIVLRDTAAAGYNITILYHVYLKDSDAAGALSAGDLFSFTGQFVAYTPLNSLRSGYIIDILFQTGSVTFE